MDTQKATTLTPKKGLSTNENAEPAPACAPRDPAQLSITPPWIAGMLSMALYWAWFFVTMFSDAVLLPVPATLHIEPIFRSVCFAGIIASLVALHFFARRTLRKKHGTVKILLASLAASPWLYLITALTSGIDTLSIPLEVGTWLLEGVAFGALLFITSAVIVNSSMRTSMSMLGISVTIGATLYIIISLNKGAAALIATALLPFLCALFFYFSGHTKYQESEADQLRSVRPMGSVIDSFTVQPAQPFYGMAYGLAVGVGVSMGILGEGSFPLQTASAFCLAGPALVILSAFSKETTIESIQWALLPVAVAGLLCVTLDVRPLTVACCAMLAFCWNFYDLTHTLSLSELMAEQQTIEPSIFTAGKILFFAGTAVGWSLSALLLYTGNYNTPMFTATLITVAIASIAVIAYLGKPHREDKVSPPPVPTTRKTTGSWPATP